MVVAWQSPFPPCSFPSTTPRRRSVSTGTRSASRSAWMSRPTASAGSPSARPGQDVGIVLFQPHGGRSQAEGDALAGARDTRVAAGRDLQLRRPRHDVREGPGVGRRGAAGAEHATLGSPRLRVPRPVGQPRPHRASLTVVAPRRLRLGSSVEARFRPGARSRATSRCSRPARSARPASSRAASPRRRGGLRGRLPRGRSRL